MVVRYSESAHRRHPRDADDGALPSDVEVSGDP
jgi:hypothetical protein